MCCMELLKARGTAQIDLAYSWHRRNTRSRRKQLGMLIHAKGDTIRREYRGEAAGASPAAFAQHLSAAA
jgi:hypothetical protein